MTSLYSNDALTKIGSESSQPVWFQTSTKKIIPNHLTLKKRPGFQLSAVAGKKDTKSGTSGSTRSVSSSEFNVVSFGTNPHKNSVSGTDSLLLLLNGGNDMILENDEIPLYNNSEDLPPLRSLYDLNDEVMISLNKPVQNTDSFIHKDPRQFSNIFSKEEVLMSRDDEKNTLKNALLNSEAAILVFGYPENMANQVIAHFLELGTILEKFEASKESASLAKNTLSTFAGSFPLSSDPTKDDTRQVPIFSGQSWVKITYDNPTSAIDALQQSGTVFNGVLIGVIPYTKDSVEKLQKRKITLLEDIGAGLFAYSNSAASKGEQGTLGEQTDIQPTYARRLDIKDGSGLFLTAQNNQTTPSTGDQKKNSQKLGFWGAVSNYLFGFYDL